MKLLDLERCQEHVAEGVRARWRGAVDSGSGVLVEASGVPAAMGELCTIHRDRLGPVDAEVVGFRGSTTLLMPHGDLDELRDDLRAIDLPLGTIVSADGAGAAVAS